VPLEKKLTVHADRQRHRSAQADEGRDSPGYTRDRDPGCQVRQDLRPSARVRVAIRDTTGMNQQRGFSTAEAREIGERIGIEWESSRFDVEQFRMGLAVELEHGRHDSATNVTDDDELTTGKIAWAHLNEFPDYYTRLAQMEAEAEEYWAERETS
jgi:hypothetical protein